MGDAPPALSHVERERRLDDLAISMVTQARRLGATDEEVRHAIDGLPG